VAVGGIAFDDRGRVLLCRRGQPPGQGLWSVPGGRLEPGETLRAACAREFREETGLTVAVGAMATVDERMSPRGEPLSYHYVIIGFVVTVTGGTQAPASDVSELRWCTLDEAEALPHTSGLIEVLRRARARVNPVS
jgi:ADP-ribose pyrophosphatase YjhB (NUDIX family)